MPDLTSEFLLQRSVEIRLTKLTDRVKVLSNVEKHQWEIITGIIEELKEIKKTQYELIMAHNKLTSKKTKIAKHLGNFSSFVLKRFKAIYDRLEYYDCNLKTSNKITKA